MKRSLLLGIAALLFGGGCSVVASEATAADTRLAPAGNRSQLPSAIQVLEPADGSAVARGGLRIRVALASGVDALQIADVELTLIASRKPLPTGPVKGWGPQDPVGDLPIPATVITWRVPLDALVRGWVPPRDERLDGWNGPVNVHIYAKKGQAAASSDPIVFTLGSNAQRQAAMPAAMSSALPPKPVASGSALTNQANRFATPLEIVEPAAGSTATQGNVRVHVRTPTGANATQMADVELSWLPPRPNGAAPPSPPAVKVKTWQAPLAQLAQGVVLPRDVTGAWTGPTLVRVRLAGESAWSTGVSFDLISVAGRQVTTPANTPNWTAATPAPIAKPAQPAASSSLGRINAMGSAASGAPASALQSRP
jgi:hypothetical protein